MQIQMVADASEEFRRVFTGALEEESGLELAAETGDRLLPVPWFHI